MVQRRSREYTTQQHISTDGRLNGAVVVVAYASYCNTAVIYTGILKSNRGQRTAIS